jgi:hypothetical protein
MPLTIELIRDPGCRVPLLACPAVLLEIEALLVP